MFTPAAPTTFVPFTLREASRRLSLSIVSTTSVLPPRPSAARAPTNSLVFGCPKTNSSTTTTLPSRKRSDSAERNAPRRIFFGSGCDQSRACGPWTLPPPFQSGERMLAMRARPVPFCFQSFLPDPETSPRVFVPTVPWRAPARWALTAEWISASFSSAPKTASDSSRSPTSSFFRLRTLTVGINSLRSREPWAVSRDKLKAVPCLSPFTVYGLLLNRLLDDDDAAVGAGHRAAHHEQVVLHVHARDRQALEGDARVAHVARRARALDDARRIRRLADGAGAAHVHRAVRLGAAVEVVALDGALEAPTLRLADQLDRVALTELVNQHLVADVDL